MIETYYCHLHKMNIIGNKFRFIGNLTQLNIACQYCWFNSDLSLCNEALNEILNNPVIEKINDIIKIESEPVL